MSKIRQNAGQSETRQERVTWRSWEPESGGKQPPLMLLHPLPHNGSFFSKIAPLLAQDRFVFAPDYPGYGGSWPLSGPPTIQRYAQAVGDAWAAQGQSGIPDLFGFHTGCLVAPELAVTSPDVFGRLVLVDVPYFDPAKRREMLAAEWAVDGFMAAFSYPAELQFPRVNTDCLVMATQSGMRDPSLAAAEVLPQCQLLELPHVTAPAMENGARAIAAASLKFLDSSM